MDIPTITLTQAEFKTLPESKSGGYDQPRCRYKSKTGQWLLIDRGQCWLVESEADAQKREDVDTYFKQRMADMR